MGKVNRLGVGEVVVGGRWFYGLVVDVGNLYLVCVDFQLIVDGLVVLDVGVLVSFDGVQFFDGVNVEVFIVLVDGVVWMWVYECGVGEICLCGIGMVVVVVVVLVVVGLLIGMFIVYVLGGEVVVIVIDVISFLCGLLVLVVCGDFVDDWWNVMG